MDPEVLKYFKRILNSFAMGMMWMLAASTAGFYFGLALFDGALHWYNYVFYAVLLASFGALLWYFYRLWR